MSPEEFEAWEIALVEMRIEKNEEFSEPETTPLPAEDLEGFEGLNYYFPEAELRFRTPFVAEAGTDTVSLTKRKGQTVPYIRRGKVAFTYEGQVHHLDVFGPADTAGGDYLWLPFFDATNGKDTYAGRTLSGPEGRCRGHGRPGFQLRLQPPVRLQPGQVQLHPAAAGQQARLRRGSGREDPSHAATDMEILQQVGQWSWYVLWSLLLITASLFVYLGLGGHLHHHRPGAGPRPGHRLRSHHLETAADPAGPGPAGRGDRVRGRHFLRGQKGRHQVRGDRRLRRRSGRGGASGNGVVPVVGAILGSFVGGFGGAVLGEYYAPRKTRTQPAHRRATPFWAGCWPS